MRLIEEWGSSNYREYYRNQQWDYKEGLQDFPRKIGYFLPSDNSHEFVDN